jgi:hypothetical protein
LPDEFNLSAGDRWTTVTEGAFHAPQRSRDAPRT